MCCDVFVPNGLFGWENLKWLVYLLEFCTGFVCHSPFGYEGVKSHSKVVLRFVGDDDKECIEFKSDEISVNEESARSVKWCFEYPGHKFGVVVIVAMLFVL